MKKRSSLRIQWVFITFMALFLSNPGWAQTARMEVVPESGSPYPYTEKFLETLPEGNVEECAATCLETPSRFLRAKEKYCKKVSPKAARRYKIPLERAMDQCMQPFVDSARKQIQSCRSGC